MAIITITVTESPTQIIAGIPSSIVATTNVPATIFYTLDGTDPNTSSNVIISTLDLPSNGLQVILKLYATNGVDSSSIIELDYNPVWVGNRMPRDEINTESADCNPANFSDRTPNLNVTYGNMAGLIVDAPNIIGIPDQFDGSGTGERANETDEPYNPLNYEIKFSTTNSLGETGPGIGTMPTKTTVIKAPDFNKSPLAESPLFNPKSMVIIQDGRLPQDPNVPVINRQYFSLSDANKERDGAIYGIAAFDGLPVTGSFLKAHYNPTENTFTYYYRDSATNRWIMSIEPVTKSKVSNSTLALQSYLLPSTSFAEKKVFQWIPFKRKYL